MLKEYMSKLPFLQGSQSRRNRPQPTERPPQPEEDLWPEGDPFASPQPEEASAPSAEPDANRLDGLFAAGRDAFRGGDYPSALTDFLQAAELGHTESQFLCGQMYRRGMGVEANDKAALCWYKRAAGQGHLESQMACGSIYEEGRGTEIDLKRALSWYERAAKQGCVDAQLKCGYMYYSGRAETRSPKKARRWLEAAAENGNEEARKFLEERF